MQELVHAHATHREGGVLPGLLVHLNLPEPTLQIHTREVSGTHHAFHGFLHTWQGIGVLFGLGVQAMKVDTEPKRPIFFSHEHNSIAPGRLRGSDSTAVQHFLDMLVKGYFVGVWCMLDFFDEYVCRCTGNPLLTYG